jgi:hypothetical protein
LVGPTEGKMDISSVGLTPSPLKLVHGIHVPGNFFIACT